MKERILEVSAIVSLVYVAVTLLATCNAHAEVLHNGRVYQTTADKLIQRDNLPCNYGPWRLETAPNGATIITRSKVCEKAQR